MSESVIFFGMPTKDLKNGGKKMTMFTSIKKYTQQFKEIEECADILFTTPLNKKGKNKTYSKDELIQLLAYAHQMGISPHWALSGGLYISHGGVEMSSRLMNALIRSKGHIISEDPKSNAKICILHGKRVDNGNTLTVSFSIEEAAQRGLLSKENWKNHPKDMLFARALSLLARRLFTDIIQCAYVEGEVSEGNFFENNDNEEEENHENTQEKICCLTEDEVQEFEKILNQLPEYQPLVAKYLQDIKVSDISLLPKETYDKLLGRMKLKLQQLQEKSSQKISCHNQEVNHG